MPAVGSNLIANDTATFDIGNDLNIIASTDTYNSSSGTETITAGGSIGNNAVQINAGYSKSKNTASGTTNNNSNILAENINITTGNDAKFSGANVNADENLTANIGGDLTAESLQDTDYASGSSFGINAGVSSGFGTSQHNNADTGKTETYDHSGESGKSGGFNFSNSEHDSAWVNDMTELTGSNVDITVGGKTTITGAMIASLDADGDDNGNLNLTTNELEYNDLHDFYSDNASGFGFSTGWGSNTNAADTNLKPQGDTTLTLLDTGSEQEQITHATIGTGSLTIANNSDISSLNRDVSVSQEITKELITGVLDNTLTIDNRVFSANGWDSIANDHEVAVDTILTAGNFIVEQTGKIIDDVFTSKTTEEISKKYESFSLSVSNYADAEALTIGGQTTVTESDIGNGYYSLCTENGVCGYYERPLPEEPGLGHPMAPWEVASLVKAGGKLIVAGVKYGINALTKQTLYRAIKSEEAASIINTSKFTVKEGISVEGKYFSTSYEGASSYATQASKAFNDGPYSIIKTSLSKNKVTEIMKATVDKGGIDTIVVPTKILKDLSLPKIVK